MTNGNTPAPTRDEIMRACTYAAAKAGYYDISEEAQKLGRLMIGVMDESTFEQLPADVTHKFYVMIDNTAYHVSRTSEGKYTVEPDLKREPAASENQVRELVLDAALKHYGYPGLYTSKEEMIAAMLQDADEETSHPVITEFLNDPDAVIPDGWIAALRSWEVTIGDRNCVVGMFEYEGEEEDTVYFKVAFS